MAFTGNQLADFAIMAYEKGTPYWYGTCWYKCTEDLLDKKTTQYPSHYTSARMAKYKQAIKDGKMCADCVGLIKGFFWSLNNTVTTKKANFTACPDYNANDFFDLCKEKGNISTIPNERGLVVWQQGHIGIYIGDGYAIEARGFAYGVQKTEVKKRTWTKWGRLPERLLTYGDVKPEPTYKLGDRVLQMGMYGEDVKELQNALIRLGISCGDWGADGDFGPDTKTAVMNFQAQNSLIPTGVFDAITNATLNQLLEPDGSPDQSEVDEDITLPKLRSGAKDKLTPGTVAYLQYELNKQGSYGLTVDGEFGPKTEAAVRSYQKEHGLSVDGIVGKNTWAIIER